MRGIKPYKIVISHINDQAQDCVATMERLDQYHREREDDDAAFEHRIDWACEQIANKRQIILVLTTVLMEIIDET